jgi:predicted HTH transcriptional regulator
MITQAAHLFSRPALEPIFEEIELDDKLVLVVSIEESDTKPHYALAEDKKWWVNEVGDLMWRPECPGPEWQPGMEWVDED